EDFEETYHKRYIVERKIAELFFRHGMRQARFFGKRKIEFQMMCKALAVNIKRLPKLLSSAPGVCLKKVKKVLGSGNNEKKATKSTV
ncbi:transposase, partial [Halarsenatibacter silvermanii]